MLILGIRCGLDSNPGTDRLVDLAVGAGGLMECLTAILDVKLERQW